MTAAGLILPWSVEYERLARNDEITDRCLATKSLDECQVCHQNTKTMMKRNVRINGFDREVVRDLRLCCRCWHEVATATPVVLETTTL
jgi:hypothetical protein